jgi:ribosome-associated heat shock protein Hsp15
MSEESSAKPPVAATSSMTSVRVDKWLWAARFFKTRSQAGLACAAGHVKLDGDSVKASKVVRRGDRLEVVTPGGLKIVTIVELGDKRGPAAVARTLYEDHSPPPPPREERMFGNRERGAGRPEKRDRRLLIRLRGR